MPSKALTVMRVRALAVVGVLALVIMTGGIATLVSGIETALGVVLLVVGAAMIGAAWAFTTLLYRSYLWRLTDQTVELRSGVVVQRHQVLPRARVQNVTKEAGPLSRALGLATVTVHSAGANTPNVTIPDLTIDEGDELRARLLPSAGGSSHSVTGL